MIFFFLSSFLPSCYSKTQMLNYFLLLLLLFFIFINTIRILSLLIVLQVEDQVLYDETCSVRSILQMMGIESNEVPSTDNPEETALISPNNSVNNSTPVQPSLARVYCWCCFMCCPRNSNHDRDEDI